MKIIQQGRVFFSALPIIHLTGPRDVLRDPPPPPKLHVLQVIHMVVGPVFHPCAVHLMPLSFSILQLFS